MILYRMGPSIFNPFKPNTVMQDSARRVWSYLGIKQLKQTRKLNNDFAFTTCTLRSFQNEGSSEKSKLWLDCSILLLVPPSSPSQLVILRTAEEDCSRFSSDADFRIVGVLRTDGVESNEEWSWNPNRLLIALAVSEMNGIL